MHNNNDSNFLSFLLGLLTGLVALILLDKDLREKAESKALNLKLKGEEKLSDAQSKMESTRDNLEEKAENKLSKAQSKLEERRKNREE